MLFNAHSTILLEIQLQTRIIYIYFNFTINFMWALEVSGVYFETNFVNFICVTWRSAEQLQRHQTFTLFVILIF